MTSTLVRPDALSTDTRYLELDDLVDGVIAALARPGSDTEDAALLTTLAETTAELATLTGVVHDPAFGAGDMCADRDAARIARLLADLATARVQRHPRTTGIFPELEHRPYLSAVLDQLALRGTEDQTGWIFAQRLNCLIDALDAADVHTRLAERVAHAISRRPDGENAVEHEADASAQGTAECLDITTQQGEPR